MARRSTKQPGALVKLFRRNRPGLGIILETKKVHDIYAEAKVVYSGGGLPAGPYDLMFAKTLKAAAYNQRWTPSYVPEHVDIDHDMFRAAAYFAGCEPYSERLKNRVLVRVRWFKKPSDWERTTIDKDTDWYPADSLCTVSAVKKNIS